MKSFLKNWQTIHGEMRRFASFYLFLDFDGTLTPIVARPELALLPPEAKEALIRLRDCPRVFLAIISGRLLEDLYGRIDIPGITYVGNHGLEIRNPAGIHKKVLSASRKKEMKQIQAALKAHLGSLPGMILEDKESILSVHYRMVAREGQTKVSKEMEQVKKKWGSRWMVAPGKMVFEIRPRADFHKGKAVQDLLKSAPEQAVLPFYFGDDQTDEDAFHFLKGKGVTVFVGSPESASDAEYYLQSPGEVLEALKRLAAAASNFAAQKTETCR